MSTSTTGPHGAMSASAENERRMMIVLQERFSHLTAADIRRTLEAANRVKAGRLSYSIIHHKSGRSLTVEELTHET